MNQSSMFAQKVGGLPPPTGPNCADRILYARLAQVEFPADLHHILQEAKEILSEVCAGRRLETGWIDFIMWLHTLCATESGQTLACLRALWWAVCNEPAQTRLGEFEKFIKETK